MSEPSSGLQGKLREACGELVRAYEDELQAGLKILYDEEELRVAENNSITTRIASGNFGKNDLERRSQLDSDCSFERNRIIEARAALLRATAHRQQWETKFETIINWSTKGE